MTGSQRYCFSWVIRSRLASRSKVSSSSLLVPVTTRHVQVEHTKFRWLFRSFTTSSVTTNNWSSSFVNSWLMSTSSTLSALQSSTRSGKHQLRRSENLAVHERLCRAELSTFGPIYCTKDYVIARISLIPLVNGRNYYFSKNMDINKKNIKLLRRTGFNTQMLLFSSFPSFIV